MKKIQKIVALILTLTLALAFAVGCGSKDAKTSVDNQANENASKDDTEAVEGGEETKTFDNVTIKIGASVTPHAELLREAAPILAKEGINLDIVELEDVVTPNTGVADGSLDANFFQHVPFLDSFNSENNTDLVSIGATHYEPFGLYAGKSDDLKNLKDGAIIGVPNNSTNEARALLLLQQEGIIKLKEGADINATVQDIEENSHNIEIKEIAPEQLVRSLPDLDFAIINGNYALEGGLKVKDALAVEAADGVAAQTYKNVIVVKSENKDDEALKEVVRVLQSHDIQDYINATYDGAVVPVQ